MPIKVIRNALSPQAHFQPPPAGTSLNGANQSRRIAPAVINPLSKQPRQIIRRSK